MIHHNSLATDSSNNTTKQLGHQALIIIEWHAFIPCFHHADKETGQKTKNLTNPTKTLLAFSDVLPEM